MARQVDEFVESELRRIALNKQRLCDHQQSKAAGGDNDDLINDVLENNTKLQEQVDRLTASEKALQRELQQYKEQLKKSETLCQARDQEIRKQTQLAHQCEEELFSTRLQLESQRSEANRVLNELRSTNDLIGKQNNQILQLQNTLQIKEEQYQAKLQKQMEINQTLQNELELVVDHNKQLKVALAESNQRVQYPAFADELFTAINDIKKKHGM